MRELQQSISRESVSRTVKTWLGAFDKATQEAYCRKLEVFRAWLGVKDILAAANALRKMKCGEANQKIEKFKAELHYDRKRPRSPATVNTYLAPLRSLLRAMRRHGLIEWTLDVKFMYVEKYKDTSGPGPAIKRAMYAAAQKRKDAKGARDLAILRLMGDRGLRRGEVCNLDLCDVDFLRKGVWVRGKGRKEKEFLCLAGPTLAALGAWIEYRDKEGGPLFWTMARNRQWRNARHGRKSETRGRMCGRDIGFLVERYGYQAQGPKVRPHGLRHTVITEALDKSNDLRAVQKFARHRSPATTILYDDNRKGLAERITRLVVNDELPDRDQAPCLPV